MKLHEIRNKHPPGTSPKHIEAMHKYMTQDGNSFQQAHNRAEGPFPALGNTGLGHCGCSVPTCPSCNKGMGRTNGLGETLHPSVLIGYPFHFAAVAYCGYAYFNRKKISPAMLLSLGIGLGYVAGRQIDMAGAGKGIFQTANIL